MNLRVRRVTGVSASAIFAVDCRGVGNVDSRLVGEGVEKEARRKFRDGEAADAHLGHTKSLMGLVGWQNVSGRSLLVWLAGC